MHIPYTIIANAIVTIMAIFWIIIPLSILYSLKAVIVIIVVANTGLNINFVNSNFIFMLFFSTYILIIIDIRWLITVPSAAPAVPPNIQSLGLILVNITFIINLIITPILNDITGAKNLPSPCRAPFIVCSNVIKIIDIALI